MTRNDESRSRVLARVHEGDERRSVRLVEGGSIALFEHTSGPDTMAAYGAPTHGHKIMCERGVLARAFAVSKEQIIGTVAAYFASGGEVPLLSDVMDLLDQAGEQYTYMAWSEGTDLVFRPMKAASSF